MTKRETLELHEAAWLLQLKTSQARRLVSWEPLPGKLRRVRGTGARIHVTVESLEKLLVGRLAHFRLSQLCRREVVAPRSARQSQSPAPLVSALPLELPQRTRRRPGSLNLSRLLSVSSDQ